MNYLPGKFIWSDEKREIYINSLLDEKSISNIIKLEELFDDQTNMVNTMSNIYKDAAKKTISIQTLHTKENGGKQKPKNHRCQVTAFF